MSVAQMSEHHKGHSRAKTTSAYDVDAFREKAPTGTHCLKRKEMSVEEVFVVVKYDYLAQEDQELTIKKNERLRLVDDSKNWWKVVNEQQRVGFVPSNYVRKESFVDKAKGTLKGLGKTNKSKGKLPDFAPPSPQTSFAADSSSPNRFRPVLASKSNGNHHHLQSEKMTSTAVAKYSYEPQREDELRLTKGDIVTVLEKSSDGWWRGMCSGREGWFPSNYIEESTVAAPTISLNGNGNAAFKNPVAASPPTSVSPKVLEVVITLYAFEAQNNMELSFKKGERLEVVDHPAHDPEWWKARNSLGDVGLVPRNYIQVIEWEPQSAGNGVQAPAATSSSRWNNLGGPYAHQPWYYGRLTRDQSDGELNARGIDGDYLVRDSESNPGDYSISLKAKSRNKHFWVQVDTTTGQFKIGNRTFTSMDSLLQHYTTSPIFSSDQERLFLVKPLPRN
ncbi:hypothetical protein QR680_018560 [Steinernema hermaphroditum]|uniref:Uncharacterized protein n=1 Tax=Steinernema hermaphroditum TaxID=289476 RepID=A0AA39LQY1_9BILA|nr:hypothetical protein QR680_018560 [Steinernema hermaphroditum]